MRRRLLMPGHYRCRWLVMEGQPLNWAVLMGGPRSRRAPTWAVWSLRAMLAQADTKQSTQSWDVLCSSSHGTDEHITSSAPRMPDFGMIHRQSSRCASAVVVVSLSRQSPDSSHSLPRVSAPASTLLSAHMWTHFVLTIVLSSGRGSWPHGSSRVWK